MARIPTSVERQVSTAPLRPVFQNPNTSLAAFGGGGESQLAGAEGFRQAAATLDQFAMQVQQERNDDEARRLETEWRRRASVLLYGDANNAGYYSAKSNDAINGFAPTRQQLEEIRREVEGTASNDSVRSAFSNVSTNQMLGHFDRMGAHLGAERITAQTETSNARIAQYVDDAALDYNNPEAFNQASVVIANEIARLSDLNGWSAEVAEVEQQARYDTLVNGVVDAALANDPKVALDIFLDSAALMSGAGRSQLATRLMDETRAQRAQEVAELARSRFPNDPTRQREFVKGALDGEDEDQALGYIIQSYQFEQSILSDWRETIRFNQSEEDRDRAMRSQEFLAGWIAEGISPLDMSERVTEIGTRDPLLAAVMRADVAQYAAQRGAVADDEDPQYGVQAKEIVSELIREGTPIPEMFARANAEEDPLLADALRAEVHQYSVQYGNITAEDTNNRADLEAASTVVSELNILQSDMTLAEAYNEINNRTDLDARQRALARAEAREMIAARDANATEEEKANADAFISDNAVLDSTATRTDMLRLIDSSDLSPTEKEYARSRVEYYVSAREAESDEARQIEAIERARQILALDPTARRAAVAALDDPEFRTMVENAIDTMEAQDAAANARYLDTAVGDATAFINGGGSLDDFLRTNAEEAFLLRRDAQAMEALRGLERLKVDGAPVTVDDFDFLASAFDPANAADIVKSPATWLANAQARLTYAQYSRFSSYVSSLQGSSAAPPEVQWIGGAVTYINDRLVTVLGVKDTNDDGLREIRASLMEELNREQTLLGREMTPVEVQQAVNRLLIQRDWPGAFNSDDPVIEYVNDMETMADIPLAIRQQLLGLYAARKIDTNTVTFEQLRFDILTGLTRGDIVVGDNGELILR